MKIEKGKIELAEKPMPWHNAHASDESRIALKI